MIEYGERDHAKTNIEVGKLEPEKRYQEIIEKKERPPQQIMPRRKQKMMK